MQLGFVLISTVVLLEVKAFHVLAPASFKVPCRRGRQPRTTLTAQTVQRFPRLPLKLAEEGSDRFDELEDSTSSSIIQLVEELEDTPKGYLTEEEIDLIRDILKHDDKTDSSSIQPSDIFLIERLLFRLVDEYEQHTRDRNSSKAQQCIPSNLEFKSVYHAWHRQLYTNNEEKVVLNTNVLPDATRSVSTLWDIHRRLWEDKRSNASHLLTPDTETLEMIFSILSKSRQRGLDKKLRFLLQDLSDRMGIEPTLPMYQGTLFAVAKSRDKGAARRAEAILRDICNLFPPKASAIANSVTVEDFNVVLTAWAKSGEEDGPAQAEKLIVLMEEIENKNGNPGMLVPNVSSFTSMIDAYAQTNTWEGVNQSERYLNRLLDFFLEGEKAFEPNIATWTIVISAFSRLSRKNNRSAASRADKLMKRMQLLHEEGKIGFGPDAIVYISVISAYAFSKSVEGPQRAEEILDEMYELYMDGVDAMKPSAKTIRSVLDGWIKSEHPEALEKAELVLDRYIDHIETLGPPEDPPEVLDDVKEVFRTMLFGCHKYKDPERANDYLIEMIEKDLQPDSFSYDRVIEAYTQSDIADSYERSKKVFEVMEEERRKGSVKPNERVYTSFIRAMTKAKVPNLSQKANVLLQRMDSLFKEGNIGIKPSVFTYNAVLMACSESENTEAFKIALEVFKRLRRSRDGPDHVTYGNMLRCARLLPADSEKRSAFIESIFELAKKEGKVNNFVLRDLLESSTEDQWRYLLNWQDGVDDLTVDLLPLDWSRSFERML